MPEKKRRGFKIYFGWWTVIVTGICGGLSYGFYLLGLSVFFKDLAADLNLGRAATSWAAGIGALEGGITSPLIGWLSDRIGPKWWVVIGISIAGTGMILMRYITDVWQYYVVWGVLIGMGLNVALTVAVDKTLTSWFVRKRGLAQGIRFSLLSIFQIVALQVTTLLVVAYEWRVTSFIWGFIILAFVPLLFLFVKQGRPEQYGMLPDGAAVDFSAVEGKKGLADLGVEYASGTGELEFTFRQAVKTLTFWTLVISLSFQNIITGGFTLHIIPFLTDKGIDTAVASSLMSMMILFAVPPRLVGGFFADRLRKDRLYLLLVATMFLHIIGIGTFLLFQNMASMYVLLICYGLSMGAATPLLILILGRYFGRNAFGSILGTTLALFAPLRLVSPVYCGWVYDTTNSYNTVFVTFIIMAAVSTLILSTLRPPKKPVSMESRLGY